MRKLITTLALVAVAALGFSGVATAGAPGPNGHNNYGLCKAYYSGSDNGQQHKRKSKPFVALVAAAGDYNGDGTRDAQDVQDYCADQTPGGKTSTSKTSSSSVSATRLARL